MCVQSVKSGQFVTEVSYSVYILNSCLLNPLQFSVVVPVIFVAKMYSSSRSHGVGGIFGVV